jgi:septum formation protein
MTSIVLASTSSSRSKILESLRLAFRILPPLFDELTSIGESPDERAIANGEGKALSVIDQVANDALVIGSDQVAFDDNGVVFHKSATLASAKSQLSSISGAWLHFATSLVIIRNGEISLHHVERFSTRFRHLSKRAIEAYVEAERPLGCAGSFMAEAAGWRLIEDTDGRDVRVLYGLPVIALFDYLEAQRIELPYTVTEKE